MNYYFSSDYHFKHKMILQYDKRPFSTLQEHDEAIINNHNSIVKKNDSFYFLGDFALGGTKAQLDEYLSRLNGNKYFIKGNHDNKDIVNLYKKHGQYLGNMEEVKVGEVKITLCHFPMLIWNKAKHGHIHLHGHCHHNLADNPESTRMDVGINGFNYFPIELSQVLEIMKTKTYKALDHHV